MVNAMLFASGLSLATHEFILLSISLAVLDASIVDQETIVDPENSNTQGWKSELSRGFSDKKVVTTVNAQFHSMETYINPNVENALGLMGHNPDLFDQNIASLVADENSEDQLLGVALMQPVTAGIEFCQIRRDRFPTLESFNVNMEPVSTMISFEDLTLLEAILERWSPRKKKSGSISIEGSSSQLDAHRMSTEMVSQSSFESVEVVGGEEKIIRHDVIFQTDRLGLVLKKVSGAIVVEKLQNAEEAESVQAGDIITAINGVAIESPSLDEVVELLATSPRPVKISFSRKMTTYSNAWLGSSFGMSKSYSHSQEEESVSDASVGAVANEGFADDRHLPDVYTVTLRRGVLNGLTVEPSPCGSLPVVIDVLPSFFLHAISIIDGESGSFEVNETLDARLPRTGAVVAEIDGKPSSEIGYLETKELLDALSSKMTDADKLSIALEGDATYSVKFLEMNSSQWGKIKTAEIGIAGIALTFIDDFKGRDMPLLRGKMDGIDVRAERGLGINPRAVIAAPPDVLDLSQNGVDSRDEITMIRALVQTEIDYYHPRIAVWEPLLEPSNLCFMVEWQLGNAQRPGQLAVEASDRFLDIAETGKQNSELLVIPRVVSLNLTDAAAEVVVRSIKEWRDWRLRALDRQEVDSQALRTAGSQAEDELMSQSAIPSSPTAQSESTMASISKIPARFEVSGSVLEARHAAAQKAAKAALVFAQKRGAGTKKESESSKPFVFRNRTGMSLSFMQQGQDENGPATEEQRGRPQSPTGMTPTFLADGNDARFHMDVISHEEQLKDETQSVKRVRAYDGQYPSLCVILEAVPGVVVKPLRNLLVYKVGNTISRLEVRKLHNKTGAVLSKEEGKGLIDDEEFSVPVVWTVEIEDNRRILTLSSAVRVISSGVSLSVDVGVCTFAGGKDVVAANFGPFGESDEENTSAAWATINDVGTARSGSPFYLPLWLALKCEEVVIFVKPSGMDYDWSKKSILSFNPTRSFYSALSSSSDHALTNWVWKETFESSCTVRCDPSSGHVRCSEVRTLWLSCISLPRVGEVGGSKDLKRTTKQSAQDGMISIAVDAGLTMRNMLPVHLQWEVSAFDRSEILPLDSSSTREHHDAASHSFIREGLGLRSGEGVDILSFCPRSMDTRARFRCSSNQKWSEWAQLAPCSGTKASNQHTSNSAMQPLAQKTREDECLEGKNAAQIFEPAGKQSLTEILLTQHHVGLNQEETRFMTHGK